MTLPVVLIIAVAAALLGAVVAYFAARSAAKSNAERDTTLAGGILEQARRESERLMKEAKLTSKEEAYKVRQEVEEEVKSKRQDISALEKRLLEREETLNRRLDIMDKKEMDLSKRNDQLTERDLKVTTKEKSVDEIVGKQTKRLEEISAMSAEQAKRELIDQILAEAREESAIQVRQIEEQTKEQSEQKSKEIMVSAIQRFSSDFVAETTVSVVPLPDENMKGRIIGREGRNIRALESLTGVDLIIDDTPEAVVLSAYDPVRREIARITLERLLKDGRIHPATIEETVSKVKKEMDKTMRETGEQAAFEVGIHGLHQEIIKLLGRLRYRTSYTQNVLQHSIEVAQLCGVMAAELGLDVKMAKRAGLLHDIGKAVDHKMEGSHSSLGAELAKKYREPMPVIDAIISHHNDVEPKTLEAVLVQAADTLSASRPGARREILEAYLKRLEALEGVANSFPGVERSFAIQAGREIRIVVMSDKITDSQMVFTAKDIAKKIEAELEYPGQIRVVLIRETRAIEYAK
jgi:ribonuclease Y